MLFLIYTVIQRVKRLSWDEIFTEKVLNDNLKDIFVIALQFSIFVMNLRSAVNVDIDPIKLLDPDVRKLSFDLHFVAI